jgi:hypothetical protein
LTGEEESPAGISKGAVEVNGAVGPADTVKEDYLVAGSFRAGKLAGEGVDEGLALALGEARQGEEQGEEEGVEAGHQLNIFSISVL